MFRNKMPLCCCLQFKKLAVWHTFGTAAWKRMLVTGVGAEESIEMITTSTSGRDGGQSRAKVNKTRRLCLSNTVTGNKLPEMELKIHAKTTAECGMWKRKTNKQHISKTEHHFLLTGFDWVKRQVEVSQRNIVVGVGGCDTEIGNQEGVRKPWLDGQAGCGPCSRGRTRGRGGCIWSGCSVGAGLLQIS